MKWGMAVALALALASLTMGLLFVGWAMLGYACAGAAVALSVCAGAVRRDLAVRRLVVAAYEADRPVAGLGDVVRLLGSRDVVKARTDYLRREDARMQAMYLRGECSDY